MATVLVGQAWRDTAQRLLTEAKVTITRQGYSDSSTTTWGFVVRTKKTPLQLQKIMWKEMQWCQVVKDNYKEIGQI